VNLAFYRGKRQVTWVMSEYSGWRPTSQGGGLTVARSSLERTASGWKIHIAERAAPFGIWFRERVEGTITIEPLAPAFDEVALSDAHASHAWQVLAPRARVRADFPRPGFSLDGLGYHDRNHGDGRLEESFSKWGWARFHSPTDTTVLYAFEDRTGGRRALWARASDGGQVVAAQPLALAPTRRLPYGMALPSSFGVSLPGGSLRCTPADLLETAPFYARYRGRLDDGTVGMGEHLDLDAFRSRWNQFLLRFKTEVAR
jgi:carotenoid 1,2-hydratase